jgi:hypothetical protein
MDEHYIYTQLLSTIRDGLQSIGYQDRLLINDYPFSADTERIVDFAAFAIDPPSYRTACLGVTASASNDTATIKQYQALGAPQILALDLHEGSARRWKTTASGDPKLIEHIDHISPEILGRMIAEHEEEWKPSAILRAKSIGFQSGFYQSDIFDLGLIPVLDELVSQKLDDLLTRTIAASAHVYKEHHATPLDYTTLFRLIFRLMTAKLLIDRRHPSASGWVELDAQAVIVQVEALYFQNSSLETLLLDQRVADTAWQHLRSGFSLANISAIAISQVYETTLVSAEARREYRTHATPPQIAEYIVNNLPFHDLPQEERRVFEPFAGHAPFLIAALERLRALLPPTMSAEERHAYFVRMLSGFDLDTFARDAALFSLMHADYPNPNGWNILSGDAFALPDFRSLLSGANIVLGNPPYGSIEPRERPAYPDVKAAYREVEALQRVLDVQPQMLGFVLPRTFIDGQSFRQARRFIDKHYDCVSLVELPSGIFLYSEVEPVLLLAHGTTGRDRRRSSAKVSKTAYPQFIKSGALPTQVEWDPDGTLWHNPQLGSVWDALSFLPQLGSSIIIGRGVEFTDETSNFVSMTPREGFIPGVTVFSGQRQLEPFVIRTHGYISDDPDTQRNNARLLPWDQPKVLANAIRLSRYAWRIAAAIDETGLAATQNFHGIWSNSEMPLEVIASILNGPVANAFLSTYTSRRHNTIERIKQIPVPSLRSGPIERIRSYVHEYRALRNRWLEQEGDDIFEQQCRELLWQIDAELLRAYDLPPKLERMLLDFFDGKERPGPVAFDRYYPQDFKPTIPWHIYSSREFLAASARQTLNRLPVIDDPILSEALKELED